MVKSSWFRVSTSNRPSNSGDPTPAADNIGILFDPISAPANIFSSSSTLHWVAESFDSLEKDILVALLLENAVDGLFFFAELVGVCVCTGDFRLFFGDGEAVDVVFRLFFGEGDSSTVKLTLGG